MLTGLLVAGEDAGGTAGLRAELPVAGQTLFEHQVRLLSEAGAERIMLLAERLTPALAQAASRLRQDGLAVELLRQADELVQRVRPDERLLLLADGVITDSSAIERILTGAAPAMLTLPDEHETRHWELIDAGHRWAGLLLVDGELARRTARMLGDWELQSTLLRNAVQAGGTRIAVEGVSILAQVEDVAAAQLVEQAISRGTARRAVGLLDRYLFDPIAQLAAPRAMQARLNPGWLRTGSSALLLVASILLVAGWRWPAIMLALLSGPVDTLGRHLGALSLRARRDRQAARQLRLVAAASAQLALGWNLREFGWGTIVLATTTVALMTAGVEHERLIGRPAPRPLWFAEPDLLIWLILPAGLAGWWIGGLAAQALVALGSLLALQRLTRRQS